MYAYYQQFVCYEFGPCIDVSAYSFPLSIFLFMFSGSLLGMLWVSPLSPDGFFVCLCCEQGVWLEKLKNHHCPACGGRVERLDRFYKNHPEKCSSNISTPGPAEPVTPEQEEAEPAKPAPKPKVIRMGILDTLREYCTPVPRHDSSRALSGQPPVDAASGNETPAPGRKEDA